MAEIIRDSSLGQLIRYATSNQYLQYMEERPGFEFPTPVDEQAKEKLQEVESASLSDSDLERAATRGLRPYFSGTTQREAVGPQRTVIQPTFTSDGTILVDWYSTVSLHCLGLRMKVLTRSRRCRESHELESGETRHRFSSDSVVHIHGLFEIIYPCT